MFPMTIDNHEPDFLRKWEISFCGVSGEAMWLDPSRRARPGCGSTCPSFRRMDGRSVGVAEAGQLSPAATRFLSDTPTLCFALAVSNAPKPLI